MMGEPKEERLFQLSSGLSQLPLFSPVHSDSRCRPPRVPLSTRHVSAPFANSLSREHPSLYAAVSAM